MGSQTAPTLRANGRAFAQIAQFHPELTAFVRRLAVDGPVDDWIRLAERIGERLGDVLVPAPRDHVVAVREGLLDDLDGAGDLALRVELAHALEVADDRLRLARARGLA